MIRIGLRTPTLLRLPFRSPSYQSGESPARKAPEQNQKAHNHANERESRLTSLQSINPFYWIRRLSPEIPTGPDAVTALNHFEERYQKLIDLLCWSAQEGVQADGIRRYVELRGWFLQNYDSVRPALTRHLSAEHEDTQPHGAGEPAPRDAFESLFLPASLDALIHSDTVISRIQRTRTALEAYRDQQVKTEA